MNWFSGYELDGQETQGCWIRVELKLAFKLVLYGYQPEIEIGLGQQKVLQVSFLSLSA
ncbi:hypothetical protein M405DRAFT_814746 [Rhizopogon salebrosus TDB-379]|nr:hypothetical protein M405DRAFT_814746 [Rhizopogon salebrosus TDB-379]